MPLPHRRRIRGTILDLSTLILVVIVLGAAVLPWASSGDRSRTSFELVAVAGAAGVLPHEADLLAPLWFLLPALCGGALVATGLRHRLVQGVATSTIGTMVGIAGLLVSRSPLGLRPGAALAMVLGPVTAVFGLVVIFTARRESRR